MVVYAIALRNYCRLPSVGLEAVVALVVMVVWQFSADWLHKVVLTLAIPKQLIMTLGVTEHSIGFDTAVNIAAEALDRLHFTAASRVMIWK